MAPEFEELEGASSGTPSLLRRWVYSLVLRRLSSRRYRDRRRRKFEKQRVSSGEPHRVEFFFQVDDPYSYLAAQVLQPLLDIYDIELVCHVVSGTAVAEPLELAVLQQYAQRDCAAIAPHYGLAFPDQLNAPGQKQTEQAARMLAAAPDAEFPQLAVTVGEALWSGDLLELKTLAYRLGEATPEMAAERQRSGDARRLELGHTTSAMFWYGNEWYWGIDRLYHLENRLTEMSLRRDTGRQMLVPRPSIEKGTLRDHGTMTLEVYPALRSPYSAIIFDKAVALARHMRVGLIVRPVMPMALRGSALTAEKTLQVVFDAGREASAMGVAWGQGWDPQGEPVRKCLALYRWAEYQGKGTALLSAFMRLAWSQKVNTASSRGFRKVVEAAGLDWKEAQEKLKDSEWTQFVEANRLAIRQEGIREAPAFRLVDSENNTILAVSGADRLWLVARVIQEQLRNQPPLDDFQSKTYPF
jgi:2-hydroxychromene-2-carboxylate isomerase